MSLQQQQLDFDPSEQLRERYGSRCTKMQSRIIQRSE